MTDLACLPDPPCDWRIRTSTSDFSLYALANASSTSRYNSRVGSYETFSSVREDCACAGKPSTKAAASVASAIQAFFLANMLRHYHIYVQCRQVCGLQGLNRTRYFLVARRLWAQGANRQPKKNRA